MTLILLACCASALAQQERKLVLDEPYCFNIVNEAPYAVRGSVATDYYEHEDGAKARHRSNFRLEPNAFQQVCSTGPFFEGWRLEIILRSLVPLDRCMTRIDMGDIRIIYETEGDGPTVTKLKCF